jgi:hypothetical protein
MMFFSPASLNSTTIVLIACDFLYHRAPVVFDGRTAAQTVFASTFILRTDLIWEQARAKLAYRLREVILVNVRGMVMFMREENRARRCWYNPKEDLARHRRRC